MCFTQENLWSDIHIGRRFFDAMLLLMELPLFIKTMTEKMITVFFRGIAGFFLKDFGKVAVRTECQIITNV